MSGRLLDPDTRRNPDKYDCVVYFSVFVGVYFFDICEVIRVSNLASEHVEIKPEI